MTIAGIVIPAENAGDSAQLCQPSADRDPVIHLNRLMSDPGFEGLADVLRTQHRFLTDLLFRTLELSMLVEAGDHRFLGWAIDEVESAEIRVAELEMVRSAMVEAILESAPGVEPTLREVIAEATDPAANVLTQLGAALVVISEEVAAAKETAYERAGQRAFAASSAVATVQSQQTTTYTAPQQRLS